ncbi:MAG: ABC transporter ATP-binding protein [Chloroflexi bacterium]|nr:ABC transporter ATP-binding protein [Chloroflexota bacterium]
MSFAIETRGLTKTYASALGPIHAVQDVTIAIPRGELFGLFGPNGAGKSTLIRMLATLLAPTAGEARVNGFDIARQADEVRASIGLVFSNEHSFYGRLTGRKNLNFFAALQNIPRRDIRRRVDELLGMFDLLSPAGRMFHTYSTGMRQKLNMARALLHNPSILFLDEPTKGMDLPTAEAVRKLLKEEIVGRQGKTVFLTTHDLYDMEQLCDRVAVIAQGQIQEFGDLRELLASPASERAYQVELAEAVAGLAARLEKLENVKEVKAEGTRLEIVSNNGARMDQVLWNEIIANGGQIRSYGPRDDGLRALVRRVSRGDNTE